MPAGQSTLAPEAFTTRDHLAISDRSSSPVPRAFRPSLRRCRPGPDMRHDVGGDAEQKHDPAAEHRGPGALPLKGMWLSFTPFAVANISAARCCVVPMPFDA